PAPASQPAGSRPALGALRKPASPAAAPSPSAPSPSAPSSAPPPSSVPSQAEERPVPAAAPSGEMPSRDDLTKARGDGLLAALKPTIKARFAAGRFVANDEQGAVFALPNQAHVKQCEPLKAEVEAALATRFGRPVPLRLVVDDGPAAPSPDAANPFDPD